MDIYTVDVSTFGSRGARVQHVTLHVLAPSAEEALTDALRKHDAPTINLLSEHASVSLAPEHVTPVAPTPAPSQHPDSIIRSGGAEIDDKAKTRAYQLITRLGHTGALAQAKKQCEVTLAKTMWNAVVEYINAERGPVGDKP